MTDINDPFPSDPEIRQAIELLFFAYRDFVADPDKVLANYKIGAQSLGRAHHRVIHFVGRNPGMTVAELLDILQITKQSLARVLRQLVDEGFVHQERGQTDQRQRLLSLTDKGNDFERDLSRPQVERFRQAFGELGAEDTAAFRRVLRQLINEDERDSIQARIEKI